MNSLKPHLIFGAKVIGVFVVYRLVKPMVTKYLPANLVSYLP